MEHFWKEIPGFFTFPDFYSWLAKTATDGLGGPPHGVEIGVHAGQSVAYLAVELATRWESAMPARIDLVDHFAGGVEPVRQALSRAGRVIGDFHQGDSWDMASKYADGVLDFVFIDADHAYSSVKRDIAAWRSKVRPGGIIAGHDFCRDDALNFGVIEAVTEAFDRWEVFRGVNWGGDQRMQGRYFPVWCVRL